MKIAICSHDGHNYFGGPYEWVKRIGKEWRNRGYEVVYLFFSDHNRAKSSVYKYVLNEGFKAYHLSKHSLTQWNDHTESRVSWFVKKAKKVKPDIFIANHTLEALYACPQIGMMGIKTFGVYHTDDKRHLWFKDQFVSNRNYGPANIVFVSQFLYKKHGAGINEFVIGCGAPIPEFKARFNPTVFKFVYAGKITNEAKRITDAIKAFIRIFKKNLTLKIEFHLYGDGDKVEDLKLLMQNWEDKIFYHGYLSLDSIQKELAKYQSFVLLSDYEGLPISVLEAMAVGLVPICLDIPSGIPELLDNGLNGFIVKDREESLEKAVVELAGNPQKWKLMSLEAREKVKKKYSTPVIADLWEIAFQNGKLDSSNSGLNLPPVHPQLKNQDIRKSNFNTYFQQQSKRLFQKIASSLNDFK